TPSCVLHHFLVRAPSAHPPLSSHTLLPPPPNHLLSSTTPLSFPQGAATSCFLAAHPSVAGASGGYYADSRAAEGKATALSKDMELAGKLWELSEQVASKQ
ncbi:unnamed protein product, partial [Closterium sp. NIES-65]